jgi:hypothetical protein
VIVDSDQIQTVRGRNWPVIEFCSRTIRVSVRSDQNSAPIAQRHVSDTGRFRFRWIPDNRNIGPGRWRLVARMRCESGKDGSTFFVRARTPIRIQPQEPARRSGSSPSSPHADPDPALAARTPIRIQP